MKQFVVFVAAILAFNSCQGQQPEGARGAAFEFAKQLIPPALKNPASAKFEWESVEYLRTVRMPATDDHEAANIIICQGIVRATNSFNAVVPSEWSVCMHHDDTGFTPILANLDDKVVFRTDMANRLADLIIAVQEKKAAIARQREATVAEERARQLRMTKAYDAGKKVGAATAVRMKWARIRVPQSNVDRAKRVAVEEAGFANAEELGEFTRGFVEAVEAIRKK